MLPTDDSYALIQVINDTGALFPGRKRGDRYAGLKMINPLPDVAQFCLLVRVLRVVGHAVHDWMQDEGSPLVFLVEVASVQGGQTVFHEGQCFWANMRELSVDTNCLHLLYQYLGRKVPLSLKKQMMDWLRWDRGGAGKGYRLTTERNKT